MTGDHGGGHGDMDGHGGGITGPLVFTSNDAAHLFFGLPVMIYGHLIALDAYNALGRGRKLARWGEGTFLVIFGFAIFALDIIGYRGCAPPKNGGHISMCRSINEMHMLIGLFMMALGTLSLMQIYMRVFEKASMWMTSVCLSVIGIFMVMHEQGDDYGHIIHTSFVPLIFTTNQTLGISAQVAALLRGLTIVEPQRWGIFTAYFSSITALCFVSGSDYMDTLLSSYFMGHTVVLGVITVSALLLIPFMLFIAWMNHGTANKRSEKVVDTEIPLIGGKYEK